MGKKKIVVALDKSGNQVVVIKDIIFYGKKSIPWSAVEEYLKRYIGDIVLVADTEEENHIDSDFLMNLKVQMIQKELRVGEIESKLGAGYLRNGSYFKKSIRDRECEGKECKESGKRMVSLFVRVDKKRLLQLYDVIDVRKEWSSLAIVKVQKSDFVHI